MTHIMRTPCFLQSKTTPHHMIKKINVNPFWVFWVDAFEWWFLRLLLLLMCLTDVLQMRNYFGLHYDDEKKTDVYLKQKQQIHLDFELKY